MPWTYHCPYCNYTATVEDLEDGKRLEEQHTATH